MIKANEHQALVNGVNLSISTKQAVEISKFIKGKKLQKSKAMLTRVIEMKEAVPFTRFKRDIGHRPGKMAAGRYPQKASQQFIVLLKSLESNALNKGLDTDSLVIKEVIPNKASSPWHPGRLRRRKMKRTHVTILAEEVIDEKVKKPVKKQELKVEVPKQEVKPEQKQEKEKKETMKEIEKK